MLQRADRIQSREKMTISSSWFTKTGKERSKNTVVADDESPNEVNWYKCLQYFMYHKAGGWVVSLENFGKFTK